MTLLWFLRTIQTTLFDSRPTLVTNSFLNNSQLKPRIQMLVNPKTRRQLLWKYALVLPLLAVLLSLTAAHERIAETLAGQPEPPVTVSGRVVNATGQPLAGVSVMDGHRVTKTDSRGVYKLTQVAAPAKIMFGHIGFEPALRDVSRAGTLNMTLRRTREELPVMGATAAYRAVGVNKSMPASADPVSTTTSEEVFTIVEQKPEFPDGIPGLMYYVAHNLRYPAQARKSNVQGTVFVKFVVSATGLVNNVRVQKGIGYGCDQEAVRVVSQMPKWKPAKQYSKPVSVEYIVPIQFALDGNATKKSVTRNSDRAAVEKSLFNARSFSMNYNVPLKLPLEDINSRAVTMNNGEPLLIFIDGVEQKQDYDLNKIKPDEIESVTVLKAASAEATYGGKGKNGVVLITTKPKKP